MAQQRIDHLVALVESERDGSSDDGGGCGGGHGGEPFRVALVGDSIMMQQHGVLCAFLGERSGRRFDIAVRVDSSADASSCRGRFGARLNAWGGAPCPSFVLLVFVSWSLTLDHAYPPKMKRRVRTSTSSVPRLCKVARGRQTLQDLHPDNVVYRGARHLLSFCRQGRRAFVVGSKKVQAASRRTSL